MEYRHSFIRFGEDEIPIFIISLAGDTERRNALKNYFDGEIVDNYYPAADLRSACRSVLDKFCDNDKLLANPDYFRVLRGGEIGCATSHRNVYQYMIQHNLPFALILEDDVKPREGWHVALRKVIHGLPNLSANGAFLIHLGLPYFKSVARQRVIRIKKNIPHWTSFYFINRSDNKKFWLGHAYLLTVEAARRILEEYEKIECMCDDWNEFYQRGCFEYMFCSKPIFDQDYSFTSNLRGDHPALFNNSKKYYKNIYLIRIGRVLLRKLKWLVTLVQPSRYLFLKD